MTRADAVRPRVLQSTPTPGPRTNPYVTQLHQALRDDGVDVVPFTWRSALLGRYDVLHTHWPENLLAGRGALRTLYRRLLVVGLLGRLALTRTPVVRTVHNTAPHEPVAGLTGVLLRALERRESWWIRLNPTTPVPDVDRSTTVLHGDYVQWFAGHEVPDPVPGRIVLPGVIRAYKGVDVMLDAMEHLRDVPVSLHVVGRVEDGRLGERLESTARQDPRVLLTLRHVDDGELAQAVGQAQLVVLPYRHLENSGTSLLALSLARPVLMPRTAASARLAAEVGGTWVHLADVEQPEDLARAVRRALADASTARPGGRPDLSARDWARGARLHVTAYTAAVQARAGARRAVVGLS